MLVGRLAQTSGGWTVPLVALAVVAALQVVVAVLAGRVPGAGRLRPHLPDEGVVTGSSLEEGPEED